MWVRRERTGAEWHSVDDTERLLAVVRDTKASDQERSAAAWALVGNYRPLILKTVVSVVRSFGEHPSDHVVERLHNDAALKLVGALDRFDGEARQFGAWSRVVVRHLVVSTLSAEARDQRGRTDDGPLRRMAAPTPNPAEQLEAREDERLRAHRLAVLDGALERLRAAQSDPKDGERYRAFYLKEQDGLTFAEIATRLHISESSARNRHREARQRLQQFIDEARGVA